jgi:hypothetical protein
LGRFFLGIAAILALVVGTVQVRAAPRQDQGSEEVDQGQLRAGFARHPLLMRIRGRDAAGEPLVTNTTPTGYTPAQIQSYLDLSGDGAGQTIAIVDAFDNPSVTADLNTFSAAFSLPLTCGSAGADPSNCFDFIVAKPQGQPPVDAGWALEISLDVQWAHAVAPKATILLVETLSNSNANLLAGIDYAAQQGASVISNSWGEPEFSGETSGAHCNLSAAICTFSTGDSGNPGGWPAYDPFVVAVGGTTLTLAGDGSVTSESAWSGSGGGISQYLPRPGYQVSANPNANRGIPDVSYNADPNTGFSVYDSVKYHRQTGWFQVGGTSAGAPQWAGIIAVSNQIRATNGLPPLVASSFQTHLSLYSLSGLNDVTSGSNGACGAVCQAQAGFDYVTGLGSPRGGIDLLLAGSSPANTPTPTATNTSTATATSIPATPTATSTPTPTPTPTVAPSSTPTDSPTRTPTQTATAVPTDTAAATSTATPTSSPTETPTPTETTTPTPSNTPVPTATDTPTPTYTATPSPTDTPVPTATETPNPTDTATPTPTNTAVPTATDTPTPTATDTPANSPTPTPTNTAVPTATDTPTPTPTPTSTPTGSSTPTATPIDPLLDSDGDSCPDVDELAQGLDPFDPWDYYNVPVPALFAAPDPMLAVRDNAVSGSDAEAVFAYAKAGARVGVAVYEQDLDLDGHPDGEEYDRTFVGPGESGPPDGVVSASDAQIAFAQSKLGHHC